jgi:hypothetical protein
LTGIGAIVLAIWAVNRYFRERNGETNLSIELTKTDYVINNYNKVYLDVSLENRGKVAIRTFERFTKGKEAKFTYIDKIETIKYSIELQVKRVKQSQTVLYYWFDPNQYAAVTDPINLLTDLEVLGDPKNTPFFIEPNETYHLGCWLQLDKGLYEAKVIVVGRKKKPDEFWHRRFPFEVK